MEPISAQRRREIIDALRRGTVPQRGLDVFAVGLDRFGPALDEELGRVAQGGGVFKAVRGEYGSGKTFYGRWLQERAKRSRFATAEVQISETETPLHRLETVYRRALERLSTADCFQGAFRSVIDGWFYGLEEEVLAEGRVGQDADALARQTKDLLERRLGLLSKSTPQFALALRAYRQAQQQDPATADGLIAWLAGQPHVGAAVKRAAGLKGDVDHFAALSFLQGLLLVFCDSRSRVEQLAAALRSRGARTFVSHSSLSLDERRQAEAAFAEGRDCVIVATSALELGVDVGDLDRVVQIDAPATVSSFLQRMGRTGRRPGAARNCLLLATTDDGLLRAAGLLRLWTDGFVEPVQPPPRPWHVLAQQLMALALQEGGIGRREWFSWVDAVPAFREMDGGERERLATWMIERGVLWDEEGILWLGREGQDTYGRKHFLELFSVFTAPPEFAVLHGRQELGFVHETTFFARREGGPMILLLAGRSWRLTHLDWQRRTAQVEPWDEGGRSRWRGQGQPLSFALCQAIRGLLASEGTPDWWSRRAWSRVAELREEFSWLEADGASVLARTGAGLEWWTFAGGRANACLARALGDSLGTTAFWDNVAIRCEGDATLDDGERALRELRARGEGAIRPAVEEDAIEGLKFSDCLPPALASDALRSRLADRAGVEAMLDRPPRLLADPGSRSPR